MQTLLWHDYETWGIDPKRNFPSQFAAIRTDMALNIIGDPVVLYAKPPTDRLPEPSACLVTGQTPQNILANDCLTEAEFICRINAMMSEPNTCVVGYNNIRFDDEVTRFALFRNLLEPYAREWQNGCSRWDLLDVLRLARALRPDGINWAINKEGKPTMRLEDLSRTNNIKHSDAHDALADVYATIAMAQLLKTAQPKLYDYAFNNRQKPAAKAMLNIVNPTMLLHISGMYSSERGNCAVVMPIAQDPNNPNAIAVYDLSFDADILLSDDIKYLNYLLFTKQDELKKEEQRLPIKTVHINKCPVLSPLKTLDQNAIKRHQINLEKCEQNFNKIKAMQGVATKIQQILSLTKFESDEKSDPELSLYQQFPDKRDMNICQRIHRTTPEQWHDFRFNDARYTELFFRFKARNYPKYLTKNEKLRWQEFCQTGIKKDLDGFNQTMDELISQNDLSETDQEILNQLTELPESLINNMI